LKKKRLYVIIYKYIYKGIIGLGMRIFGIDPGYAIVGYGIVDYDGIKFNPVGYGAVTTAAGTPFSDRLLAIYNDMNTLFSKYKPDCISIEKLYFNTNTTTAIDVAEARGVILLCAKLLNIPVFEYTPLQVKQAMTGYGRAEKHQVMDMVKTFLRLDFIPKPDDAADALALCICHGHTTGSVFSK